MWTQKLRILRSLLVLVALILVGGLAHVSAAQSTSTNYSVNEVQIGGGSSLHDCSTNYCAKTSIGDTTVGDTSSTNYKATSSFNTSDVPLLEVIVVGGDHDLGVLEPDTTASLTEIIKVRNYLSNGYVMQISGAPPSVPGHTLRALSDLSTSQPGAEQFGINLADNTSPDIGADALQIPSGDFSYGSVADDYASPDLFKYENGAIIGQSLTSTGETDYTLSMILNISNTTAAGKYHGQYSVVVTATF
jgi:hypothetical protein